MKRTRLLATVAALGLAASVAASASASASAATPTKLARPTSTVICGGTSLVLGGHADRIRVPTVANAHPSEWGCNLLPSDVPGLIPVERLQIDLNDCYGFHLAVDGEYGPLTASAVRTVQGKEGVSQDGDYGPQTIEGRGVHPFLYQISGGITGHCDSIAAA
jgi:hypothetical protein